MIVRIIRPAGARILDLLRAAVAVHAVHRVAHPLVVLGHDARQQVVEVPWLVDLGIEPVQGVHLPRVEALAGAQVDLPAADVGDPLRLLQPRQRLVGPCARLHLLGDVARRAVDDAVVDVGRGAPAQPDIVAVLVPVAVLELRRRPSRADRVELLRGARHVVGVLEGVDPLADQLAGLVAQHARPAAVGALDVALRIDDDQQLHAEVEEPALRVGGHSSSPERIATATAAARSETPSFS
jgi:hypothetical protein